MFKVVLSAAIGGVAGSVLVLSLQGTEIEEHPISTKEVPKTAVVSESGAGPHGGERNVDLLRKVRRLEKRLAQLEEGPKTQRASRVTVESETAKLGTPADESSVAVSSIVSSLEEDNSPIRIAVQGMIDDTMENRTQEWRAVRRARSEARDEERLNGFAAKVDLSADQRQSIRDALDQERDQIRDTWRSARETMQFEGMREKMKGIRSQTDEDIAGFLSEEQIEEWKTYREENWGRRRR